MYWNVSLAQDLKTLLFGSGLLAALGFLVALFCYALWHTHYSLPARLKKLGKNLCFLLCFVAVAYPCRYTHQVLSLPLVSLTKPEICTPAQLAKVQNILVLGGGSLFDGVLSISSQRRVHAAIELLQLNEHKQTIVFTGGRAKPSTPYESMVMGSYYKTWAPLQNSVVLLEELRSLQTRHHPIYIQQMYQHLGRQLTNPVIVTSDFHILRSVLTFRKYGVRACGYPASSTLAHPDPDWFSFTNAKTTKRLLNEYLGILAYWIKGWI